MVTKKDLQELLVEARVMLTDQSALRFKEMYPVWKSGINITQTMLDEDKNRFQYNDKLYKCIQSHTTQSDWTPDVTPALWVVIDVEHQGTFEDPIPASVGMEYVKGKYYIEGRTIYLMNRQGMSDGESVVLQFLPSALVGQYFEIVSEV